MQSQANVFLIGEKMLARIDEKVFEEAEKLSEEIKKDILRMEKLIWGIEVIQESEKQNGKLFNK